MTKYCVLVADSARGRIFRAEAPRLKGSKLDVVYEQMHFQSRRKRAELESDRPGTQRSGEGGFHGLGGDRDSHEHEHEEFARELCRVLEQEIRCSDVDELSIAAPPHFLGLLRRFLGGECRSRLKKTLDKSLLECTPGEISELLA